MNAAPTDTFSSADEPPGATVKRVVPGNATADQLIAAGRRPMVLGSVVVTSGDDLSNAVFAALAHVADGADGIDLTLPGSLSPAERLAVADQLAQVTGVALCLRTDVPMACGQHTLIVSTAVGRLRASVKVMHDLGLDSADADPAECTRSWPTESGDRALLLSTTGFADLSDAALMGLASAASARGVAAVATDRARIVRRVLDTLAPLHPAASIAGETACP